MAAVTAADRRQSGDQSPREWNRRFVVTNMSGHPQGLYQGLLRATRQAVPEQPIGELKNGLLADRLSFHHFRAQLLEAVGTRDELRSGGVAPRSNDHHCRGCQAHVNTCALNCGRLQPSSRPALRHIWFHFSETWPHQDLWHKRVRSDHRIRAQIQQGLTRKSDHTCRAFLSASCDPCPNQH